MAEITLENMSRFGRKTGDDIPEECKNCTVLGCGGKSEDHGMGCVHVYYGTGKGKTAQSMGLALRAASDGHKVLMYQFIVKRDEKEQDFLNQIPGITFVKAEPFKGFAFMMDDEEKTLNREVFDKKLDELFELAKDYDVLILDEILYAVEMNLLSEEKLLTWFRKRPCHLEVVLTGKVVSEKVLAMAEFVTHIEKDKDSSMDLGIFGRLGLEK